MLKRGVKKTAGRHTDATTASKNVGQENKKGRVDGFMG
jgi:hypothetical protein